MGREGLKKSPTTDNFSLVLVAPGPLFCSSIASWMVRSDCFLVLDVQELPPGDLDDLRTQRNNLLSLIKKGKGKETDGMS